MNLLYVTSEAVPFCKTGGLADVAGSLPCALAQQGESVSVILPLYGSTASVWREQMTFERSIQVRLAWRSIYCGLFSLKMHGVTWLFVDNEQYFKRPDLYGYYDDGERFGFFSRAVTELLKFLPEKPDVVHCNDWQSALVPVYVRDEAVRDTFYRSIRTVLTIHNIEYQGKYGRETVSDLFGLNEGWYEAGTLEFDGCVNLLKAAILVSDAVTTVSPTYARELREPDFAHGLDPIIRMAEGRLSGVLNGIDTARYDPHGDRNLSAPYSVSELAGKATDKEVLQHILGLRAAPDTPVIAMVSRLVGHKGLDLVCEALDGIMEKDVQLAVLGKGEGKYESFFSWAQSRYPGRIGVHLGYSESLAMQIYAGADFFLMPSRSEPCGLSQMIAMRYGAVPIVRETGGLKDTVRAYDPTNGTGNGFSFAQYNAGDLRYVVHEAIDLYHNEPEQYHMLQCRDMQDDFSWHRSAEQYRNICRNICN